MKTIFRFDRQVTQEFGHIFNLIARDTFYENQHVMEKYRGRPDGSSQQSVEYLQIKERLIIQFS